MTKALIQKNIKLSLEFDSYVSRNPSVLKSVPRGADIVITSSQDTKLSDANLSIARESRTGRFVEAHKSRGSWKIRKIKS